MKEDNCGLLPQGGKCFSCGVPMCPGSAVRPDIVSAGFPCPPFSKARQKTGRTAKTGPTEGHPDYNFVMVDSIKYLQVRQPFSFFVKEVLGFLQPLVALDGLSPCQVMVKKIELQTPYSCQAVKICHSLFVKNTRGRVWLVGVHQEAGGAAAAVHVRNVIVAAKQNLEKVRDETGVPSVFDIVNLGSVLEQRNLQKRIADFFL